MTYFKKSILKAVITAFALGLGYIVIGGLYVYFASDWMHNTVKTIDDFAKIEKIKYFIFIVLTGLIVLFLSLLITFRINYYANKVFKQQKALLENEQRATAGIFAASIAHDATNIITSLRFCIELLGRNTNLCASSQDLITTMKQALQDLSSLNKRLLDCSKHGISGDLTEADLVQEIEKTLRLAKVSPRITHCEVQLEAFDSLIFSMNILLMNEMILNLAINAGDAIIERGTILVKIDQADCYAVIEVHDNGPGIPLALREKIFDPFFTTKKIGTGLGLLTVKACAEFHKGWVEVSNSPILGGALFRIWIPMNISQASQSSLNSEEIPHSPSESTTEFSNA